MACRSSSNTRKGRRVQRGLRPNDFLVAEKQALGSLILVRLSAPLPRGVPEEIGEGRFDYVEREEPAHIARHKGQQHLEVLHGHQRLDDLERDSGEAEGIDEGERRDLPALLCQPARNRWGGLCELLVPGAHLDSGAVFKPSDDLLQRLVVRRVRLRAQDRDPLGDSATDSSYGGVVDKRWRSRLASRVHRATGEAVENDELARAALTENRVPGV